MRFFGEEVGWRPVKEGATSKPYLPQEHKMIFLWELKIWLEVHLEIIYPILLHEAGLSQVHLASF